MDARSPGRWVLAAVLSVPPPIAALHRAATDAGLDPLVLAAVCEVESGLRPWALNVRGRSHFPSTRAEAIRLLEAETGAARSGRLDVGLCQVNSRWTRRMAARGTTLGLEALLDPIVNARFAAHLLAHEIAVAGDRWTGVARYHTGPVTEANRDRGRRYAERVRRVLERHRGRAGSAR